MERPYAAASQLAQAHPLTVGAVTIYSASYQTEITRLRVTNCHSATAIFSLFHDDDGAVYSRNSALEYEYNLGPNRSLELLANVPGGGVTVKKTGTIGFQSSGTANFTVSIYGITEGAR